MLSGGEVREAALTHPRVDTHGHLQKDLPSLESRAVEPKDLDALETPYTPRALRWVELAYRENARRIFRLAGRRGPCAPDRHAL